MTSSWKLRRKAYAYAKGYCGPTSAPGVRRPETQTATLQEQYFSARARFAAGNVRIFYQAISTHRQADSRTFTCRPGNTTKRRRRKINPVAGEAFGAA